LTATNYAGNGSALSGKQSTINSTAGQLIIGNGNGSTTTSSSLTFSGTTLTATNINATSISIGGTSLLTNQAFTTMVHWDASNPNGHDTSYVHLYYDSNYIQHINIYFGPWGRYIGTIRLGKANGDRWNYSSPYMYNVEPHPCLFEPYPSYMSLVFWRYTGRFVAIKHYSSS